MAKHQTESRRLLALSFDLQTIALGLLQSSSVKARDALVDASDVLRDLAHGARRAELLDGQPEESPEVAAKGGAA